MNANIAYDVSMISSGLPWLRLVSSWDVLFHDTFHFVSGKKNDLWNRCVDYFDHYEPVPHLHLTKIVCSNTLQQNNIHFATKAGPNSPVRPGFATEYPPLPTIVTPTTALSAMSTGALSAR